jgi:hypothetical protein
VYNLTHVGVFIASYKVNIFLVVKLRVKTLIVVIIYFYSCVFIRDDPVVA